MARWARLCISATKVFKGNILISKYLTNKKQFSEWIFNLHALIHLILRCFIIHSKILFYLCSSSSRWLTSMLFVQTASLCYLIICRFLCDFQLCTMYDRAPRSLTQPQGSTADHVGPGTYDSSFGKKGKAGKF